MSTLNKSAAEKLNGLDVHAVTDVTGFGLLGHLKEICQGSAVSAEINFSKLSFLPGVWELAKSGIIPGGTRRNLDYVKDFVSFDSNLSELDQLLATDAQTSGGLLISLSESEADTFIQRFGINAKIIGRITKPLQSLITLV